MSTQLEIVYKLKEALETGKPEVATPFMTDDFAHQALPAQSVCPTPPGEIATLILSGARL